MMLIRRTLRNVRDSGTAAYSILVGEAGGDEALEERVRGVRFGLEFRVILARDEPRVGRELDRLDEVARRGGARDHEAAFFHGLAIRHVELVSVPVALGDLRFSVNLVGERAFSEI